MLPDIPEFKREAGRKLLAYLRLRMETADPVLAQVRRFTQHEGTVHVITPKGGAPRADGFHQISSQFEVHISEVPDLVGQKLTDRVNAIADDLVRKSAKMFFDYMHQITEENNMVVNAKDKGLPEALLEMIEKVETDFDAEGRPTNMFVIHPSSVPTMQSAAEQIENDPELKRRQDEIRQRQIERWTARENNRKLVD